MAIEVKVSSFKSVPGVSDEANRLIREALLKGKRSFGSAGASLTHLLRKDNPLQEKKGFDKDKVLAGLAGEREGAEFMIRWAARRPDIVLVHSTHIRKAANDDVELGADGVFDTPDTDLLVMLGNQALVWDHKLWKGGFYTISPEQEILRGGKSFPGSNVRAIAARMLWVDYLTEAKRVESVVSLGGIGWNEAEELREEGKRVTGVKVFRNPQWYKSKFVFLDPEYREKWLDKWYERSRYRGQINSSLVAQAVVCAIKPYDRRKALMNNDLLRRFE